MKWFVLGIVTTLLVLTAGAYLFVRTGGIPMETAAPPLPLEKTVAQFQEQIEKGTIINPVTGLVLTKYALQGEITAIGKPLYKIANVDTLVLRAYITGSQLSQIKNGQQVQVRIDQGEKNYKLYTGQISWISGKSEFTPKTIQTKDERANLVYAIKVRVKNDGYLKIGMYGEVIFGDKTKS